MQKNRRLKEQNYRNLILLNRQRASASKLLQLKFTENHMVISSTQDGLSIREIS